MRNIFLVLILIFILKTFKPKKMFTEADAKQAILAVQKSYGLPMAKNIEKMMRLETNHFKSKQYQLTGSAGMEVGKWKGIPKGATAGTIQMSDSDLADGIDTFIVWKSVKDFCFFLAEYINRNNGNFARWNSTNTQRQTLYAAKLEGIKNRFV